MLDPRRLRRLAVRLAGGRPIDWNAEDADAANDAEREAIRQFRLVAAMTAFHQDVQSSGPVTDLSASVSLAKSVTGGSGLPPSAADRADHDGATLLPPGSHWGHLEILEKVGSGSFGEVFRSRDPRLDRVVALKLLGRGASGLPDRRVREASLLARVRHPNVVTVYGADRVDERVGIWMEFLQGETLDRTLRAHGALDAREAALIGIDLCRALSAVHAAGIVHQDVKLANVMRSEGGRIVLMDFGLGREPDGRSLSRQSASLSGTPLFMAPEALLGGKAEPRSDLYSLGVVLFALATGSLPLEATSLAELIEKHRRGAIRHARDVRPDLPDAFTQVFDRLLSPDPEHRFATAGEVERSLLHALGVAVQAPPDRPAGIAAKRSTALALGITAVLIAAATFGLLRLSDRARRQGAAAAGFPEAPSQSIIGQVSGEMFGLAVACIGDADQDGHDDLLVGAPEYGGLVNEGGRLYLFRGNDSGFDPHPIWTATTNLAVARLGWSIASLTNLSFDGFPDLVVGSPGGDSLGTTAGRVLIYQGSKAGYTAEPTQILTDHQSGANFGYAIATGDVDHDGFDDLLVGEPQFSASVKNSGRALLYMARAGAYEARPACILNGPPGSQFGISADLGGDLNNDGYRDAVIGAASASFGPQEQEAGAAYVYLGSAAGLDTVPIILPGREPGGLTGRSVLIPGDLDGDGCADLLVGAEQASDGEHAEGVLEIYFGSKSGLSAYGASHLEPDVAGANFGGHLAALGDLDGDGCGDFFVGAVRYQRSEPREGAGFVFDGSPRHQFRRRWFQAGGKAGTWYGASAASGDFNNDKRTDLVVGAPAWDNDTGMNVGRIDLFLHSAH